MKQVLIIGTGGIGKRHIRGFLKTGRARLHVCEPDDTKRGEVLRDYDIDKGYGDIGQAPLDSFDLAVIAAPAHVHIPLGRTLADAGVPFLMEKPLSISMDGVDQLIETIAAKGLLVRVGYVTRCRQWVIRMRDDIRSGRIGPPRMAVVNTSQHFPKYRPDYRQTYYAKRATGGGAILDGATHSIDILLWLMGPVVEVGAMYDRLELQNVECEDTALISLRFRSGAVAQIVINQFQQPLQATIEVIGPAGNLRVDNALARLEFADDDSGNWQTEDFIPPGLSHADIHESMFAVQANAFMDTLEGRPDILATLDDARANLAICLAALESYRTKRIVALPRT